MDGYDGSLTMLERHDELSAKSESNVRLAIVYLTLKNKCNVLVFS